MSADDKVQRVCEATGYPRVAAAFALGRTDGDELEAIAFLWSVTESPDAPPPNDGTEAGQ